MSDFYVYIHARPDGTIFYCGKGLWRRATQWSCRTKWHKSVVAKYGKKNIIVKRFLCQSEQDAFDTERLFIRILKERGELLVNLTNGGEGASGYKPSNETRQKLKKTPEQRAHLSCLATGKKQSTETIKKRVAHQIGKPRSDAFKEQVKAWRQGAKHTDDAKAKISAARTGKTSWNKGVPLSDETRKKMSEAKKGKPQSKEHKEKRLLACAKARELKTLQDKKMLL